MPKVSQGGTHWRPKTRVCVCARTRARVCCVRVCVWCVCVCVICVCMCHCVICVMCVCDQCVCGLCVCMCVRAGGWKKKKDKVATWAWDWTSTRLTPIPDTRYPPSHACYTATRCFGSSGQGSSEYQVGLKPVLNWANVSSRTYLEVFGEAGCS